MCVCAKHSYAWTARWSLSHEDAMPFIYIKLFLIDRYLNYGRKTSRKHHFVHCNGQRVFVMEVMQLNKISTPHLSLCLFRLLLWYFKASPYTKCRSMCIHMQRYLFRFNEVESCKNTPNTKKSTSIPNATMNKFKQIVIIVSFQCMNTLHIRSIYIRTPQHSVIFFSYFTKTW